MVVSATTRGRRGPVGTRSFVLLLQLLLLCILLLFPITAVECRRNSSPATATGSRSPGTTVSDPEEEETTRTSHPFQSRGKGLPRSSLSHHHHRQRQQGRGKHSAPPWNPSAHIDENGFLHSVYHRIPGEWEQETAAEEESSTRFRHKQQQQQRLLLPPVHVRQVPGDGNCLFHSISLCLHHAVNGTHWDFLSNHNHEKYHDKEEEEDDVEDSLFCFEDGSRGGLDALYDQSRWLRQQAVQCLQPEPQPETQMRGGGWFGSLGLRNRPRGKMLFLQDGESILASDLVEAAAQQYNLSPQEYCQSMQQECVWGGGPEIVALSNLLQRPIHVYELATMTAEETESSSSPCFVLRRMACFGSPKFDRRGRPTLHILSADSRFPDLRPGKQAAAGNHFLALFPVQDVRRTRKRRRKRRLRGGGVVRSAESSERRLYDDDDTADSSSLSNDDGSTGGRQGTVSSHWWKQWWRTLLRLVVE